MLDAEGQPLGRLASQVALLLRGKHRPTFTPHLDNGDFVIVVNARRCALTGSKAGQKIYYRHTGYPGGLKETILDKMMEKHPDRVVQKAVKGMLPHNRLSRKLLGHLKVYGGPGTPARSAGERRPRARAASPRRSPHERQRTATTTAPAAGRTPSRACGSTRAPAAHVINDRTFEDVFPRITHRYQVLQPLTVTETAEQVPRAGEGRRRRHQRLGRRHLARHRPRARRVRPRVSLSRCASTACSRATRARRSARSTA